MSGDPSAASERPFFVIGSPRSGTTLLRLMLTAHPQLVVPPECGFVTWLHPAFGAWRAAEFGDSTHRSRFATAVCEARKFETWNLAARDVAEAVSGSTTYAEACASVYRLYAARRGKPTAVWGDKNNYYLSQITLLKTIFPASRVIHIVRDGRDVTCSCREVMSADSSSPYRPSLPVRLEEAAERWANDIRAIRSQLAALRADDSIELRYEDLVCEPTRELPRLCAWLGVDFAPEMLSFHALNESEQLEPSVTMDWKRRTLEPPSAATVGRYRTSLTPVEIEAFSRIAGPLLARYGYPP
jgi:hypothetical protein